MRPGPSYLGSPVRPEGFVAVTKTWEVECSECGIVDGPPTKRLAEIEARRHRRVVHGVRGWLVGGTYRTLLRKLDGG